MKNESSQNSEKQDDLLSGAAEIQKELQEVLDYDYIFENVLKKGITLKDFLCNIERCLLVKTLAHFDGSQKKTCDFLEMNYTTMYAKCKRYNIRIIKTPQ